MKDESDLFGSNAVAPFYLIQSLVHHCQDKERNKERNVSVVNMVDAMTNQPLLGFTMYTMAKHALEGLTKSAAVELAPLCIRVNGVAPGLSVLPVGMSAEEQDMYRTKVPLYQREAQPEDIARTVAFVVSDNASYLTGSIINVDGGWSLTRQ
ncbi:pteridine reductase [Angomonas deanei]|nr:pteridine reductase [Angomonas deanei]|eukprot:EPY39015.1 pteridine reductase [Angomonas deanei]